MLIEFDPSFPKALQPITSERMDRVAHLFPIWCNRVFVCYEINGEDIATCNPRYEYRIITLTLHPSFFETDNWEFDLIHEIGHALINPITSLMNRVIDRFVPDGHQTELLRELLGEAEEMFCEDLAIMMERWRMAQKSKKPNKNGHQKKY